MTPAEKDAMEVSAQYGAVEFVERVAVRVYNGDREITREVFGAEFGDVIHER